MKAYITGVSGTGKTTIEKELRAKNINAFSIDEVPGLCQWVSKEDGSVVDYEAVLDKSFIDSHEWVCDINKLSELVNHNGEVIILGLAANQNEFLSLLDKILLLQCSPETFLKRIAERTDNDFGKDPSAQEYILNMYQDFESDLLRKGAISIDAEKSINEVVENILREMR